MKFAQRVRSLALRERVGVREGSGARRHFIVRGGSARPMIVSRDRFATRDWAVAFGVAVALHLLLAWLLVAGRPPVSNRPAGPSGALAVASLAWRGSTSASVPALAEARPVTAAETLAHPVPPPEVRAMTEVMPAERSRATRERPATRPTAQPPPASKVQRSATARGVKRTESGDPSDRAGGRAGGLADGKADGQDRAAEPLPGNPRPRYPRFARSRGHEGRVLIRVAVLGNGDVGHVVVAQSSGHRSLDRAALAAVKRWRFRPALREGEAVAATLTVPVLFRLEESG